MFLALLFNNSSKNKKTMILFSFCSLSWKKETNRKTASSLHVIFFCVDYFFWENEKGVFRHWLYHGEDNGDNFVKITTLLF